MYDLLVLRFQNNDTASKCGFEEEMYFDCFSIAFDETFYSDSYKKKVVDQGIL